MVEVAGPGVAAAAGEHAVGVAQQDLFAHRWGWVVLVDRPVVAQVEDGAEVDLAADGAVPGQPVGEELGGGGAELLDRHRAGAVAGAVAGEVGCGVRCR